MKEYIWYKDGKEFQRSKDIEGKLITKKITGVDTHIKYAYYKDGVVGYEIHFKNGDYHRDGDKPAYISYDEDGDIYSMIYYKNGREYYPPN